MRVKKGDLVQVDLPHTGKMNSMEIQEELFTSLSLLKNGELLIVVTSPYEHSIPTIQQTNTRGRMFVANSLILCVDLLLGSEIYKSVPIKYLKRAQ